MDNGTLILATAEEFHWLDFHARNGHGPQPHEGLGSLDVGIQRLYHARAVEAVRVVQAAEKRLEAQATQRNVNGPALKKAKGKRQKEKIQ